MKITKPMSTYVRMNVSHDVTEIYNIHSVSIILKIGTRVCKKNLRRRVNLGKEFSKKLYSKQHAAERRNLEFGSNKLSMKASGPKYSGALGVRSNSDICRKSSPPTFPLRRLFTDIYLKLISSLGNERLCDF